MYSELITEIFETVLIPLLAVLTGFLVKWINAKAAQIKETQKNAQINKYITLLNETITKCVVATNQTYVDSLKGKDAFTKEAQEEAFKQTKEAVLEILNEDAATYLQEAVGDLDIYITQAIEAAVNENKTIITTNA